MNSRDQLADAIISSLQSPNVSDSNLEAANVVDVIDSLADSARLIARAITASAAPGTDATGGTVDSLTEAVMGITGGLVRVADSIADLAAAVRERSGE